LLLGELKPRGAYFVKEPAFRAYHCYEIVVEDKFGPPEPLLGIARQNHVSA